MLTSLILLGLVAAFVLGAVLKPFWQGLSQELGAAAARGLVRHGGERRARRAAARARSRAARGAIDALTSRAPLALPAPGAPAPDDDSPWLAPGLRLSPGPLASGTATVIWIGADAQERALAAPPPGPRIAGHRAVTAGGHRLGPDASRFADGPLEDRLAEALADADRDIEQGRATFVALIARLPLTGGYAADREIDLDTLFGPVLAGRDTWLTWLTPVDTSQWGDDAYLTGPGGADATERALVELGFGFTRPPVPVGEALRLSPSDAARAVLALAGESAPDLVDATGEAPQYAARAAAVVSRAAVDQGRAQVSVEGMPGLGAIAKAAGYSLRFASADAAVDIDLDEIARQFTAYAVPPRPRPLPAAARGDSAGARLDEAVRERDAPLATSALVREGRAWIEAQDAAQRMASVESALATFGRDSEPGAWAHFLIALERALRLRDAPSEAFADSEAVARYGIADLYDAEAMEFARLRGDLDLACRLASPLMARLARDEDPRTDAERYARGTGRFLVANLLRNGGLYRQAETWIRSAESLLDDSRPAQEAEILHCRYALGVCAAMAGRVLLQPMDSRDPRSNVFARALLELSNSHAAWLERDLSRAVVAAGEAQALFSGIGYQRYAQRAADLRWLLLAWQRLSAGDRQADLPDALARLIAGRPSDPPIDLSEMRPSRALGLLQFAVRFRHDAQSPPVLLPTVLAGEDGRLVRRAMPQAECAADADRDLRVAMAVPRGADVPLLAD